MSGQTRSRDPGVFVGVILSAWTIAFTLAEYYRSGTSADPPSVARALFGTSTDPLLVTLAGLACMTAAGLLFAYPSRIARSYVKHHLEQIEEGGYCPWAFLGGLGIMACIITIGTGLEILAYSSIPLWEIIFLIGNSGLVAMCWWSHLAVAERQPPVLPEDYNRRKVMLKALEMETQFLRNIVTALSQSILIVGGALLAGTSILLSSTNSFAQYGSLVVCASVVWILGLHVSVTRPFMRRHGQIVQAMVHHATGNGSKPIPSNRMYEGNAKGADQRDPILTDHTGV